MKMIWKGHLQIEALSPPLSTMIHLRKLWRPAALTKRHQDLGLFSMVPRALNCFDFALG